MINSTKQLPSWLLKHLMHEIEERLLISSDDSNSSTSDSSDHASDLSSNCGTGSSSDSDIPDELDEGLYGLWMCRLCIMASYISVTHVLFPNPTIPKDTQLHLVLTEYCHGHPH